MWPRCMKSHPPLCYHELFISALPRERRASRMQEGLVLYRAATLSECLGHFYTFIPLPAAALLLKHHEQLFYHSNTPTVSSSYPRTLEASNLEASKESSHWSSIKFHNLAGTAKSSIDDRRNTWEPLTPPHLPRLCRQLARCSTTPASAPRAVTTRGSSGGGGG